MARGIRADSRPVSGIVLVDKPGGLSSNRVLQQAKRLFRARKAGHTGTLDPMATGMLPVCFGHATRVSGLMLGASKRYRVTAAFGEATDTGDADGSLIERREDPPVSRLALESGLEQFRGRIEQVPPMYSALKQGGRRLYELARAGIELPREPRTVELHEIVIEVYEWPRLTLMVHCSKGTYIRSLVTDLAGALGTVAHVAALRRLAVGPFEESGMVSWSTLEQAAEVGPEALDRHLLGADSALLDRPAVTVGADEAQALRHGRRIRLTESVPCPLVRVYDGSGAFIGLAEVDAAGELRPRGIFPE